MSPGVLRYVRWAVMASACAPVASGAGDLEVHQLLQEVASTYRADKGMRIKATNRFEVGGLLVPHSIEIELELLGEDRICASSSDSGREKTTGCTDGHEVWLTLVLGKRDYRRWDVTQPQGEGFLRLFRQWRYRYHGRFAELDKAKLGDAKVRYRNLRIGNRTLRCAVVRIESPFARRGKAPEDLWIELETRRVVRTELYEFSPQGHPNTTIVTFDVIEPLPSP